MSNGCTRLLFRREMRLYLHAAMVYLLVFNNNGPREAMAVNIVKLCVGVDTLAELAQWQETRVRDMQRRGLAPELMHITRQTPKRAGEVLDGGSLYWVIKGVITARQKLLDLRPVMRDDIPHCALVYDPVLILVRPTPRRPFQGWRYLETKDSPPDVTSWSAQDETSESLRRELAALGLA